MTYIKYFFEDKNNKLYYESDDEDEVLNYILDEAGLYFKEFLTSNTTLSLQHEIRQVLKERYINQFEEYDDYEEDKQDEEYRYYFDEGFRRYSEYR